jgi:hypothetical protein
VLDKCPAEGMWGGELKRKRENPPKEKRKVKTSIFFEK